MTDNLPNLSKGVLRKLSAIEEGNSDSNAAMEFVEEHRFFANLDAEKSETKEAVRNRITELLGNDDTMYREDIEENNIEDRLKVMLQKIEDDGNKPKPKHADLFNKLIEESSGHNKAFYNAIDEYTSDKPEDRDLFVKVVELIQKNGVTDPETLKLQQKLENLIHDFIEGGEFHPRYIRTLFSNDALGGVKSEIEETNKVPNPLTPLDIPTPAPQDVKIDAVIDVDDYLKFLEQFCGRRLQDEVKKIIALKNLKSVSDEDEQLLKEARVDIEKEIKELVEEYSTPDELSQKRREEKESIAEEMKTAIQNKIIKFIDGEIVPKLSKTAQNEYNSALGIKEKDDEDDEWGMGEKDEEGSGEEGGGENDEDDEWGMDEDSKDGEDDGWDGWSEDESDEEDKDGESDDDNKGENLSENAKNELINEEFDPIVINLLKNRLTNEKQVNKWDPACSLIADLIAENNVDIEALNKHLACPEEYIRVNNKNRALVEQERKITKDVKNYDQLVKAIIKEVERLETKLKKMKEGPIKKRVLSNKNRLIKLNGDIKKLLIAEHKNMRYESPMELLKEVYRYIKPHNTEDHEEELKLQLGQKDAQMRTYKNSMLMYSAQNRSKKLAEQTKARLEQLKSRFKK